MCRRDVRLTEEFDLKPSQREGTKKNLAASKMVPFFTAGNWEKDTTFGAAGNFFGSSYFVAALVSKYWIRN